MNRKLASGGLAGVAALALAFVGPTYSTPTGSADVPGNTVRAGVLLLDLGPDGAATTLGFHGLLPGGRSRQLIWVAANDATSSTPANLAVTFRNLRDEPARCTTVDKVEAELASGVSGCTLTGGVPAGMPEQGNLSRLLSFDLTYSGASGGCSSAPRAHSALPEGGPGNLRTIATRNGAAGTTVPLAASGDAGELVLRPGQGVCVAVSAYWPPDSTAPGAASPQHPLDNAAQDDSFTVDVRFDLTQVR